MSRCTRSDFKEPTRSSTRHQQFGIPLPTALALLTDLHGDIVLDAPVVVDHGTTQVHVGAAVRARSRARSWAP
jgi:hypothetical protein